MSEDIRGTGAENAELENDNPKRTIPSWSGVGSFFSAYREPQQNSDESAVIEVVPDAQDFDVRSIPGAPLSRAEPFRAPSQLDERMNHRPSPSRSHRSRLASPTHKREPPRSCLERKPQANVQEAARPEPRRV